MSFISLTLSSLTNIVGLLQIFTVELLLQYARPIGGVEASPSGCEYMDMDVACESRPGPLALLRVRDVRPEARDPASHVLLPIATEVLRNGYRLSLCGWNVGRRGMGREGAGDGVESRSLLSPMKPVSDPGVGLRDADIDSSQPANLTFEGEDHEIGFLRMLFVCRNWAASCVPVQFALSMSLRSHLIPPFHPSFGSSSKRPSNHN